MFRTLKPFEYFEPGTVKEAVDVTVKCGAEAKVFAAGVDLVPRMRKRQLVPKYIVNIQSIREMTGIREGKGGLIIGSLSSLRSIETSPLVQKKYMVLSEAIHSIASIQVKSQGTAVGNLCVGTPASDVAPALMALDGSLKIVGKAGEKIVAVENFYLGVGRTVLEVGDIITEILLPEPRANMGGAFFKLVRTAADIAKVNVAVTLIMGNGVCQDARVIIGSVAPTVLRVKKVEDVLKGRLLSSEVIGNAAQVASEEVKPITDLRSTAEYRRDTTRVLVRRAIEKAQERAKA
jgi:CO/xanthine dehydrogenase FAD-binding subunit